jgi:hypothetical protein
LYVGVPDLQGTNSGPQVHLRRGCEPIGGTNSSAPHLVILNFYLDSYLFRSLVAQGLEQIFTEKGLTHSGPREALPEVWEQLPLSYRMSTAGPLGGGARDPGIPTINVKNDDGRPPGRRCQRSGSTHQQQINVDGGPLGTQKTSMVDPLGGGVGDLGAHTINARNVDGGPLGGDAGDPRVPTINAINFDGGPPGRRCRRSRSAHHQREKRRQRDP